MNIGANIKKYRVNLNLTQKDLADKIGVTYQAVSRWENNEVEPSLDIINKLSEIFKISVEELITNKVNQTPMSNSSDSRPVVGVCDHCHKAIREGDEFKSVKTRGGGYLLCDACDKQIKAEKKFNSTSVGVKKRRKGYILGTIVSVTLLVIGILLCVYNKIPEDLGILIGATIFLTISGFTLTFCACVNNNPVTEVWYTVCEWGFVKFPGLIFSISWGGILFFITFKLIFGILAFLIGAAFGILATLIALLVSIFVFPYAIIVSYKHPEKSDDF